MGFWVCLHGDGDGDARARAHRIHGGEFTKVCLLSDGRVHGASSHVGDGGACGKVRGRGFGSLVFGVGVWGLGCGVWGVGCGVWGLPPYLGKNCMMAGVKVAEATWVWGLGFKVRVLGVGFWV